MAMVVSILAVPSTGNALTATSGQLVAYWAFEETSGVRYDSTENNNDLTDNNTVLYGTGIIGNAADFEASNSERLTIEDASQTGLDITNDRTWCWWSEIETAGEMWTIGKWSSGYYMGWQNIGGIKLMFNTTNDTNDTYVLQDTVGWHFYCITYDLSAGTSQAYENGVSAGTGSGGNTSGLDNANTFVIGNYTSTSGSYDGLLDEVSVWSTILSTDDIQALYNSGVGLAYADLFGSTSTTSTSTATTTSTVDVEELKWVLELYLAIFTFLIFTYVGYRFTKLFL